VEVLWANDGYEAMKMMRKFRVVINGKEYVVEVEELSEMRAREHSPTPKKLEKISEKEIVMDKGAVLAPMPGKIVSINVKVGDSVKKGEVVAILEAMKMENEVLAPHDGIVKEIRVKKGANVSKGQAILILS